MKNILLITFAFFVLSNSSSFAQTSVQLNIHHKLGDIDFAMNTGATNNMGDDFNVTRLQYYITEFTVVHDGGTETLIDDLYVLVDASTATQIELGSHDITEVEAINFHIGVGPDENHLDPASYASDHPLAPQNPSMHWGWTAGYRFVALEGNGSSNYDQEIELHGLGDGNFYLIETSLSASADNNAVSINLDADYTRALEDLSVNGGLIVHSITEEAREMVKNFRDFVFSPSGITSATVDISEISRFVVYPNPTLDGATTLFVSATEDLTYEVSVTDILGKQVQHFNTVNSNTSIDLNLKSSGLYIVNLIKDGQTIISKKLLVAGF